MLKHFLIILFVSAIPFLNATKPEENKYSVGSAPAWVKSCDFSLDPIPLKPSQINYQVILHDIQKNWEEKATYIHEVFKVLTNAGVKGNSEVHITFSPSYQQAIVHQIRIYRDGQWNDRLNTSRHQVLQRENDLENKIYDGKHTLVYFLDDIRVGDIIEYSYSLFGEDPFSFSRLSTAFYLQGETSLEKAHRRLLIHPSSDHKIQLLNSSIEPNIRDLTPDLREFTWESFETEPCPTEKQAPSWYNPYARVHISQFKSWEEVAKKVASFFVLSEDFTSNPSPEIKEMVNEWIACTQDPQERALLALRFVQDQVRYMGFEEGMGGYKPKDPSVTFKQRFGDCKDKAFLLHALLKLMDIDSTPALVSTTIGVRLHEILPSPWAFDHVILCIDLGAKTYWVDGTHTLQGGSLENNFTPFYHQALLISDKTTDLTLIPEYIPIKPTEIETSYTLSSLDFAEMKTKVTFYGNNADRWRNTIERNGVKKLSENWLDIIQRKFRGASIVSDPIIQDDRDINILTIEESYKLYTKELKGNKAFRACSFLIDEELDSNVNLERKSPYDLSYPNWVQEHIHIESPHSNWKSESESTKLDHESLSFSYDFKIGSQTADFYYELRHLKDHVPQESIRSYWDITNKIEDTSPQYLYLTSSSAQTDRSDSFGLFLENLGYILLPLSIFIILTRRRRVRLNKAIIATVLKKS